MTDKRKSDLGRETATNANLDKRNVKTLVESSKNSRKLRRLHKGFYHSTNIFITQFLVKYVQIS